MSEIPLRNIPSVQEVLQEPSLAEIQIDFRYLKSVVQETIEKVRSELEAGAKMKIADRAAIKEKIVRQVKSRIERLAAHRLKRVINGTGIILHTNLGRAPIAPAAALHLEEILQNYCNLEFNLETGKRGRRTDAIEEILCLITGAEAVEVVNNNAAAVLIALNSLCSRKEVPVSRGELVEIGGSFRMPEVMKISRAKMVEVGTTNKTHLQDYEDAINDRTGAILKVHTSNYRVLGFTDSVPVEQLAGLAKKHDMPLIYDMGSGVIEDLANWGHPHEPVARDLIEAGADIITFSGDKILGGPQAGIIIGKKEFMREIKKNHLLRALRCDKLTYALLDATLRFYLNPAKLPKKLPVAAMLTVTVDELKRRGQVLIGKLKNLPLAAEVEDAYSQMGSGALPLEKIPSAAVGIVPQTMGLMQFAKKLRMGDPAVACYIENDKFMINLRTVREDEISMIAEKIVRLFDKE